MWNGFIIFIKVGVLPEMFIYKPMAPSNRQFCSREEKQNVGSNILMQVFPNCGL